MIKNNFKKNFRTTKHLVAVMYKDRSESYTKIFADIFIILSRFGILTWLYYYLFQYRGGTIMGESFQTIIWSMFLYFCFMNINPRSVCMDIQRDINTGNIENLFAKPVNYLLYRLGYYLGARINIFLINTIFGIGILSFFLGIPKTIFTWTFLLTFPLTFILCLILSFFIYSLIGLSAFWLEDIQPIRWIIDKMVMVLGGAFVPVAFFPDYLKALAIYSPFGASQMITHTVYATWVQDYLKLICSQIIWIIILGIAVHYLSQKAYKSVSVNGG